MGVGGGRGTKAPDAEHAAAERPALNSSCNKTNTINQIIDRNKNKNLLLESLGL